MDTAPTYALSSRTPRWALDPYRFPGLEDTEDAEALGEPAGPPAPAPAGKPHRPSR
ncbi:hypothetical protein AB0469_30930 [Streptomyces sp. NPDC093801]|uniref:hypothetical protein n=1 Tax=Streptomyces sp. NPDC093801 TaxID=3155203 RepID=UPI00344BEBE7